MKIYVNRMFWIDKYNLSSIYGTNIYIYIYICMFCMWYEHKKKLLFRRKKTHHISIVGAKKYVSLICFGSVIRDPSKTG